MIPVILHTAWIELLNCCLIRSVSPSAHPAQTPAYLTTCVCIIIVKILSSHSLYWKTSHRQDHQGNEYNFILWWQSELGHSLGMCAWGLFLFSAWTCDPKQCPGWNVQAVQTLLPPTARKGHCPTWGGKIESALPSVTSFHVQGNIKEAQCGTLKEDCVSVLCFTDRMLSVFCCRWQNVG